MSAGIGYVIGALILAWVIAPLVIATDRRRLLIARDRRAGLRDRRDHLYEGMRDLDFEFQTGKLTVEDHRSVRDELVQAAAVVLAELEAAGKEEAPVEQIDREHLLRARSMSCPSCKRELAAGQRFCEQCGSEASAICRGCGSPLRDGARFCGACGEKL